MCVPPAEPTSFPQRDSTTRACGAEACRAPPPAVASQCGWCAARQRLAPQAWAQGVGAGESQVLFRRLRGLYIHVIQFTISCCTFRLLFFLCELGSPPLRVWIRGVLGCATHRSHTHTRTPNAHRACALAKSTVRRSRPRSTLIYPRTPPRPPAHATRAEHEAQLTVCLVSMPITHIPSRRTLYGH